MADKDKQRWHGRGLTSLLTLAGFIIMGVTGLVLYFVPQGRIAYWTHWTFLGLDKTQWGDIHILSSVLFVAVGIVHTVNNWRRLWGYLKDKARGGIKLKKELLVASAVSVLLVISGIVHLPPLSFLLDLNAVVKDAWVGSKDEEPPFGHAELLAPEVFCAKVDIAYPEAKAVWEAAGIVGLDSAESLDGLARMNDSSPIALYRLIKHLEKSPVSSTGQRFEDAEAVQRAFGGTGIGNKSIEDLAARVGQPSVDLRARLKARGIELGPDESLKQAASRLDKQPLQLLEAALVELKTE